MHTTSAQLLSRREFAARCAALGLSLPALSALFAMQRTAPVLAATAGAYGMVFPTAPQPRRSVRARGI